MAGSDKARVIVDLPRLPNEVDHCRFCGIELFHNRDFTAWVQNEQSGSLTPCPKSPGDGNHYSEG